MNQNPTIYLAVSGELYRHVYAFTTAADRNAYVAGINHYMTHAIERSDVSLYVDRPRPFSGQARCVQLLDDCDPFVADNRIFGQIVTDYPEMAYGCDRLSEYKVAQ